MTSREVLHEIFVIDAAAHPMPLEQKTELEKFFEKFFKTVKPNQKLIPPYEQKGSKP